MPDRTPTITTGRSLPCDGSSSQGTQVHTTSPGSAPPSRSGLYSMRAPASVESRDGAPGFFVVPGFVVVGFVVPGFVVPGFVVPGAPGTFERGRVALRIPRSSDPNARPRVL